MILKVLLALVFFGFMIFIHELGHFLTARLFKIDVTEFAVGMGPKLISKKSEKTGIVYSLRALPVGGFVSIVGEDGEGEGEGSFTSHPWWQRFIVLFAGAFMNILSAIIVMFIMLASTPGYATTYVCDYPDYYPLEESVIYEAGIRDKDKIIEINGEKMNVWQDVSYKIMSDGTEPVDITVLRDGKKITFEDIRFKTEYSENILVGICDFAPYYQKRSFKTLVRESFYESFSTVKMIYSSLFDLIRGKYGIEAMSGPVGTVKVISESADYGIYSLLYLFVFISMNLGLFNLFPFPALDGGRLLFIIIEALRGGKKIDPKVESAIHFIGIVILFGFMIFITLKDIQKL